MPTIQLNDADALVVVDVQKDFLPGGSLAVPQGDAIVPIVNGYIALFERDGLPVFATRDWHPAGHCSFAEQGGPWPAHCVSGSGGAAFAAGLKLPADATVISKGTAPDRDAYSGFEGTDLDLRLKRLDIQRLFVCGLALDVCVLNTVLDALDSGYRVFLLMDATRAINAAPGDGGKAVDDMKEKGARLLTLRDLQ